MPEIIVSSSSVCAAQVFITGETPKTAHPFQSFVLGISINAFSILEIEGIFLAAKLFDLRTIQLRRRFSQQQVSEQLSLQQPSLQHEATQFSAQLSLQQPSAQHVSEQQISSLSIKDAIVFFLVTLLCL